MPSPTLTLKQEEEDAYVRGLELDEADLAMAAVMADMRLDGTWPKGRPAVEGKERTRILARQRGINRAWEERFGTSV